MNTVQDRPGFMSLFQFLRISICITILQPYSRAPSRSNVRVVNIVIFGSLPALVW